MLNENRLPGLLGVLAQLVDVLVIGRALDNAALDHPRVNLDQLIITGLNHRQWFVLPFRVDTAELWYDVGLKWFRCAYSRRGNQILSLMRLPHKHPDSYFRRGTLDRDDP